MPGLAGFIREGVTCALAHAQRIEDPRIRGSAHRVISDVSQFLRSDLAEDPFVKKGAEYHPASRCPPADSTFRCDIGVYAPTAT